VSKTSLGLIVNCKHPARVGVYELTREIYIKIKQGHVLIVQKKENFISATDSKNL
jgi:hypothetical protein